MMQVVGVSFSRGLMYICLAEYILSKPLIFFFPVALRQV